jgi:hypothetical protein
MNNRTCFSIKINPTDYLKGDGKLQIKGISTQNWASHFDFFVPQRVANGDTDDCWSFGATKDVDAFMDALIQDNLIPQAVIDQIVAWGFMDTGIDGKPHFHSSERLARVLSGLGQNGGNLNTANDIFRKYGLVPFTLLPVTPTMTLAEYFAPIPQNLLDIGQQFLKLMGGQQFLQYQWILQNEQNIQKLAEAIPDGPLALGIPVDDAGWNQVHPVIATGNPVHVVSAYEIIGESVYVSDNYAPFLKILDPGYQISYALQTIVQYIPPAPAPTPPSPTAPVSEWQIFLNTLSTWLNSL